MRRRWASGHLLLLHLHSALPFRKRHTQWEAISSPRLGMPGDQTRQSQLSPLALDGDNSRV
jgi:hypothetical protein